MPIALLSLILTVLAVPPLTDAQRAQLDTAIDRSPVLDEGALYPLLNNAVSWDSADEAGAAIPDYEALIDHAAEARGDLFLIEGKFARQRRFGLVRSGSWGEALTEWVILVREDPDEVAVVYFVDPQGEIQPPRQGTPVRTVARFYKLWGDRDQHGDPATYLTFVGRSPRMTQADAGRPGDGVAEPLKPVLLFAPLLVLALAAYVLLRYLLRRSREVAPRRLHRESEPADDLPTPSLPRDPAEALSELERRHDETAE